MEQNEPRMVAIQRLINLVNSNELTKVVCGNSFPPARGSICGKVRSIETADNKFTVQADLPNKEIAEVSIPLDRLGIFDAGNRITVYDEYKARGHVMAFLPQ